jgi:hypothetical protein
VTLEENRIQARDTQDELMQCLFSICKDEKVALIYTNSLETQKFSAGIVSEVFDNEIIMSHFLPIGKYDGYIVKRIIDIFKVELDSKYNIKIMNLSKMNDAKHDKLRRVDENGFLTLLTYAFESEKVVTIEMFDSGNNDAQGFVERINDNHCTISLLDEYGERDGSAILNIENISHLSCDGDDEITLKELYKISHIDQ